MERFLTRLERRFGRYAFGNVTYVLVGLQALGFAVCLTQPDLYERMVLDGSLVRAGEWWRLFTWVMAPLSVSPIWVLFSLYWLYTIGTSLESEWGSFRYELYWIVGLLATAGVALGFATSASMAALVMSLFLGFATIWPRYEIRVFFVIPIQVRWLAVLDAIAIVASIASAEGAEKLVPLAAVANYLLFFGATLVRLVATWVRQGGRAGAMQRFRAGVKEGGEVKRACAVCGATHDDPSVDLRVCSCERCGGVQKDYCQAHVFSH